MKQERFWKGTISRRGLGHELVVAAVGTAGILAGFGIAKIQQPKEKTNMGHKVGDSETPPENSSAPDKDSLQIFKDFVSVFVKTEHDSNFWSSLLDFIRSAPEEELKKYMDGNISKGSGTLDIRWPKDAPINRDDQPTIKMEVLKGFDGRERISLTRFFIRISQDGRVNVEREAPNPSRENFGDSLEMRKLISHVFNLEELKEENGWEDDPVAKEIKNGKGVILAGMNRYGYVFLAFRQDLEPQVPPSNPILSNA